MSKYVSRKFILSIAAFLASIGTGVGGVCTDNQTVAIIGGICTMLSAAIYAASQAYVDGQYWANNTDTETEDACDDEDGEE